MTQHDPQRSLRMLEYIQSSTEEQGYPPSVREIGAALGLASNAAVDHHLRRLEASGLIRRARNRSRALVLTDLGRDVLA